MSVYLNLNSNCIITNTELIIIFSRTDTIRISEVSQSEIEVLNRKLETVHNEYSRIAKENVGLKQEVAVMKDEMNGMRGALEEIINKCDLNNVSKDKRLLVPGIVCLKSYFFLLNSYLNKIEM